MIQQSKILIIAPFWKQLHHVGNYRVDRFVRWLAEEGVTIILVRAGSRDFVSNTTWGVELTIRDPLQLYRDVLERDISTYKKRKPNRYRRILAYLLFNPDPGSVWAKRVARHPEVIKYGKNVRWVLSSSPPESSHLAAFMLSTKLQADLLIDMRDGWLDEPMKPLLRHCFLQRWREGLLERRILSQASQIFVTSNLWRDMLESRLTRTRRKITVLTNAYPKTSQSNNIQMTHEKASNNTRISLLHAGRIYSSRPERRIEHLLQPLLVGIQHATIQGIITFIGNLDEMERMELSTWSEKFNQIGWEIKCEPPIERENIISAMQKADGLLLLSSSLASIPAKFFEYCIASRPILASTITNSAIWEYRNKMRQLFIVSSERNEDWNDVVTNFIKSCKRRDSIYDLPMEFTEEHLKAIFLSAFPSLTLSNRLKRNN